MTRNHQSAAGSVLTEKSAELSSEVVDVRRSHIQVVISADGTKVWVNDAERMLFRAQAIESLTIEDNRKTPEHLPEGRYRSQVGRD